MDVKSGAQEVAFDVDAMLGKLAKWLRILGFDADFPVRLPRPGRVFVTMKKSRIYPGSIILDTSNVTEQLSQVLTDVGVKPDSELFLSRCLICNAPVQTISKDQARKKVPPSIIQMFDEFHFCPLCGRIYWNGSHGKRIKGKLKLAGVVL